MHRLLLALAALVALATVLVPSALGVRVSVRVEGKTTTIYGAAEPRFEAGRQRHGGPRGRQRPRRVLLQRHPDLVRALRLADRPLRGGRLERLGLQGQRRLAARRRRQGRAERRATACSGTGRRSARPAARRRCCCSGGRRAATACSPRTTPARARRGRRRAPGRRAARPHAWRLGVPRRRTRASCARRSPAPCARTPSRDASESVLLLLALALAGCGEERAGSGTASLWVTRDRGAEVIHVGGVPAGISALEALDRELDVDTALRRPLRAVDRRRRGEPRRPARLVLVRERPRGRSQRGRVRAPARRRRVVGLPLLGGARCRLPSSSARFPEPFLHGFDGDVPPRRRRRRLAAPRRGSRG